MSGKWLGLMGLMVVATGCADPIEGEWTSKDSRFCGNRNDHITVIVEDGTGFGDVCDCSFTFTWTGLSDDRYRFDIDFSSAAACLAVDGTYDCRVKPNDELDCDELGEFIKVD